MSVLTLYLNQFYSFIIEKMQIFENSEIKNEYEVIFQ